MRKAALVTFALLISSTPAVAQIRPDVFNRPGCFNLKTVKQDERLANKTYEGIRKVTKREYQILGYYERCQKNPQAQWFVRSYNRARWRQHFLRVQAAKDPTPYDVVASWYYDGGSTACGFHATYGVANKTLPCGYHVMLRHGSNSVEATVEDRGPFISGRSFDLNPSTKDALGCSDICYLTASATG